MADTVLTLSGIGVVPLSGRGITESLRPIEQGRQLRRTVNGALTDQSLTAFRKYVITLTGADTQPAALNGVWAGQAVTVGCVTELGRALTVTAGAGTATLDRKPVSGSGRAIWESGGVVKTTADVTFSQDTDGTWVADVDFNDGAVAGAAYVFYRPELSCRVTAFSGDTPEWDARPGWTLELEEV